MIIELFSLFILNQKPQINWQNHAEFCYQNEAPIIQEVSADSQPMVADNFVVEEQPKEEYVIPHEPSYYGYARTDDYIQIINWIRQYFGADADKATNVMMCESGGNVLAYNADCDCYGLFQIKWFPGRGTPEELLTPEFNIIMAKQIFDSNGWSAWGCN